jgi:hypothetical protein
MERAETNEVLAPLFQPYVLRDDIHDVICGADFFDFFCGNAHMLR